jgi:hypothetical protein
MNHPKRDQRVSFPIHRGSRTGAATPDPPASVANYLHTSGVQVLDSTNTEYLMRGAQWVGFNKIGLPYAFTPPYTEANPNPATGHGDAWQFINTYKLNTIRIGINWHIVERSAPVSLGGGVYTHAWTDGAGNINPDWDTPDGYFAALEAAINDIGNQGGRVILDNHQSSWSPGIDNTNGVGFPAWLYATTTPGATTESQEEGSAKWEFFQASGGWARPGIPGPPQDLCVEFLKLVATKFKDNDFVVGIDLLNEPGWPTAHPLPSSPSGIANPSAPTGAGLVAFYQKCINAIAAIQPHLLLIYENGTYANTVAGRSPLTGAVSAPTGSNLVMSWHYYPDNPNNAGGPAAGGAAPTLAQVNTFIGYLTGQVALAHTTYSHPLWIGETSLFSHIENSVAKQQFDYADTVYSNTSGWLLWEKLWRDFQSYCSTNHVSWSLWAFQKGSGRTLLNLADGTPKTDFLSAIGATPDPDPITELGAATPIDFATIGSNVYADVDAGSTFANTAWNSQRWKDLYYDAGVFGRGASGKTAPTNSFPAVDVIITSDGTAAGTSITAAAAAGFVVSGGTGGNPVIIACDVKVNSLKITGSGDPTKIILTGKLWCVNKNGTGALTVADYNAAFNNSDPGGWLYCDTITVALTNYYSNCASGSDPAMRLLNCRRKDATTPYFDGILVENITRDWCKIGQLTTDLWIRHGTISWHPMARVMTDPINNGAPGQFPLINSGSPPAYDSGVTYNQWECVHDTRSQKTTHKYYSTGNGNVGNALPDVLGEANASWQGYGDLHADGIQNGEAFNTTSTPTCENVFFLGINHAALFCQILTDNGFPSGNYRGVWSTANNYAIDDTIRDSAGQNWVAIQASTSASPKNPLANANPTYWRMASAHGQVYQYCLFVGNAEAIANGCEDPTNGARECLFSRSFKNNPVQGTGGGHNANGTNTTWVAGELRGIVNINNAWAGNSAAGAGGAGTLIPGAASV